VRARVLYCRIKKSRHFTLTGRNGRDMICLLESSTNPESKMSQDQIEATFLIPINEFSGLQDRITTIKHICKNNDANASFEYDGIEIHVGPDYDVGEVLSRFYERKDARNKREADKLKIYIAAFIAGAPYAYKDEPDINEACVAAKNICGETHHRKLVSEAIAKMANGEFNP
jgi:hypothetical protein